MEDGGSTARKYPCNFCDRVFITAQALGGHQNSHRRERDSIKMYNEETQFQPIQATSTISPFSHSTAQTNNRKIRDVPMPYDYNRHYPRQIYVPNRTIPKEFYYHPYANQPNTHQNGLVPWKNICFGTRYPLNSMAGHPTSHADNRSMSRYPLIFSRGESSQGHQSLRLQPQNYDFFPQTNGGEIRNDYQLNMNASISIAGNKKVRNNEGSSIAVMLNQVGEQKNNNAEANCDDADVGELDLTLCL